MSSCLLPIPLCVFLLVWNGAALFYIYILVTVTVMLSTLNDCPISFPSRQPLS